MNYLLVRAFLQFIGHLDLHLKALNLEPFVNHGDPVLTGALFALETFLVIDLLVWAIETVADFIGSVRH